MAVTNDPPSGQGFFATGGAGGSGNVNAGAKFLSMDASAYFSSSTDAVTKVSLANDIGTLDELKAAALKIAPEGLKVNTEPCSFCGEKSSGQFIFTEKDKSEVRLCSGCLTKAVSWVIAQAKGGLAVREAPADRKACAKCHRHFMPEHLHLVGKKDPVTLCDPCFDQFADSAAEALSVHRRNIVL